MHVQTGLVDRASLAVVVLDVQEKLAAAMPRRREAVATVDRLVRAAALLGAPIVVTRQYPAGLGPTCPEVAAALEEARVAVPVLEIDKVSFCACDQPDFIGALRQTERTQLVLTGMETHICVLQTALSLDKATYAVHVAADACTSRRESDHEVALDRLRAAGVVVTTSESVMYEALSRADTDEFRALLALVKRSR